MFTIDTLKSKSWWGYLEEDLQELLIQSILLIETVQSWSKDEILKLHDYSFVVFPAAKAYEGFLKKLFFDLGFITEDDYFGKRFRVGKSLNPALDQRRMKRYGVYQKLVTFCKGTELPDTLWTTWIECRNRLFHWFPNELKAISFSEAEVKVSRVIDTIEEAYIGCRLESYNNDQK